MSCCHANTSQVTCVENMLREEQRCGRIPSLRFSAKKRHKAKNEANIEGKKKTLGKPRPNPKHKVSLEGFEAYSPLRFMTVTTYFRANPTPN